MLLIRLDIQIFPLFNSISLDKKETQNINEHKLVLPENHPKRDQKIRTADTALLSLQLLKKIIMSSGRNTIFNAATLCHSNLTRHYDIIILKIICIIIIQPPLVCV